MELHSGEACHFLILNGIGDGDGSDFILCALVSCDEASAIGLRDGPPRCSFRVVDMHVDVFAVGTASGIQVIVNDCLTLVGESGFQFVHFVLSASDEHHVGDEVCGSRLLY